MLHCPQCSGSLREKEEDRRPEGSQSQPQPQPQPHAPLSAAAAAAATSVCPSGHLCPYEQQRQRASEKKASIYLSGGGIIAPSTSSSTQATSSQSTESHHQHFLRPAAATGATATPMLPPRLDLLQAQQQQQQQQQVFVATTSATLSGLQPLVPLAVTAPQVMSSQIFQPALLAPHQQPLLITSTIQQPIQGIPAALNLSQPATPAIVVGSSGSPFFQQQYNGRPLSSIQIPAIIQPQPQLFNLVAPAAQNPTSLQQQQQQQPSSISHPAPVPATNNPVSLKEILAKNRARLEECNWYYPALNWNESAALLENTSPGTFLVRDSADVRFLFSLSVQRSKKEGPTSVRIHFTGGKFKLDAEEEILHLMPEFSSVLDLIDHYLSPPSRKDSTESSKPVLLDSHGQPSSQISLKQPLYQNVPSLSQLSRLAANRGLSQGLKRNPLVSREAALTSLGLPKKLVSYMAEYPNRV